MLLLGLKYLAALVRSRVPEADAPGLSAVEDGSEALMEKADKSLGVIRHVSDALCASGEIETSQADCFLRLDSSEGRSLLYLAEPSNPDEVFLLAVPEQRTVWAVSCHRCDLNVRPGNGGLVRSAVIKAPADQPDIELVLTKEDLHWILQHS